MREYGQIQCAFWTDPDIQRLSDSAKILAAYLLTGPHSNGLGCYRLPDGYISADLGWPSETLSKGFGELFAIGFSKRCESTFFVLIPKFLHWNPITNGNVAAARVKEFDTISKKFRYYADLCFSMLEHGNHLPKGFETLLQTLCEGYGKQDPTLPYPNLPNPNRPESDVPNSETEPLDLVPEDTTTEDDGKPSPQASDKKPPRKIFKPPTLEQVAEYCRERNNGVDPARWLDHYTAKGWMLGKSKMVDWRAAVRTWEKSGGSNGNENPTRPGPGTGNAQRVADELDSIAKESLRASNDRRTGG